MYKFMDQEMKKELEFIVQTMKEGFDQTITKEEAKNFVTKDDLKNFATKDDLKAFATKDDIKELRRELKEDMTKQRLEIIDGVGEKIFDAKGDMIAIIRKEDTKLVQLVEILRDKKVLQEIDIKKIFQLEPFPRAV
jgi:hypothetical protein